MAAGAPRGGGRGMLSSVPKGLKVVARGSGGISEMRESIDDAKVQFGLVRFDVGSGAFKRTKLIFVTVLGEKCGAVAKGRILTKKSDVKGACGEVHVELQIENKDECTVENFVEKMGKTMSMDHGSSFSISKIKEDYEAMIAAAGPPAAGGSGDILKRAEETRKTAAEMGSVKAEKALEAVKKPLGPFNWAMFRPSGSKALDFYNAGSMSIPEMCKWLKDDEVLTGLVRMGFGSGKYRRVKWICVHWSGEAVSPVKRGRAVAAAKDMAKLLEPYSLSINASSADEIDLKTVIDRVRKAVVVDGGETDGDAAYSVDEFMKSLREEAMASADFFGDEDAEAGGIPVGETVADIRDPEGKGVNWVLLAFDK